MMLSSSFTTLVTLFVALAGLTQALPAAEESSITARQKPDVSDFKAFHIGQETSCTKQIVFKRPYKDDRFTYSIQVYQNGSGTVVNAQEPRPYIASVFLQAGKNRGQYLTDDGQYTYTPVQFIACTYDYFTVAATLNGKKVFESTQIKPRGLVPESVEYALPATRTTGTKQITFAWHKVEGASAYYLLAGLKDVTQPVASRRVLASSNEIINTTIQAFTTEPVAVGVVAVNAAGAFTNINSVTEIQV